MRLWYTSDLHFAHPKCAKIRGFASPEEHDEIIIQNWNRLVRKQDIVWVLGDVCMRSGGLTNVLALNGVRHLVTGNHDGPFPGNRDSHNSQRKWLEYFDSVQAYARRRAAGVEFLMSHFPYSGDHTPEDRYTQYRLRDEGMPLLHGHLHTPDRYDLASRPRQFHVGVDSWGLEPVPEELVIEFLQGQRI